MSGSLEPNAKENSATDEGRNAVVTPPSAEGMAKMASPGIQIRKEMWVTWARIAVRERERATAARQAGLHHMTSQTLEDEADAALLAVCAAAFSIESLQLR